MSVDLATIATETHDAAVTGPAGGDPRTASSVTTMGQGLVNRTLWAWRRMQELIGSFTPLSAAAPVAISSVSPSADTVTVTGHGLSSNDPVHLVIATGAAPPAGLDTTSQYYAIVVDANRLSFSLTSGPGAAEDITGALSGAVYVVRNNVGDQHLWTIANGFLPTGSLRAVLTFINDHAAFDAGAAGGPNTGAFQFTDFTMTGTTRVKLASRSITRVQSNAAWWIHSTSGWDLSGNINGYMVWINLVASKLLHFPLDLPDGSTFNSVSVRYTGATGHGAFPGGAPTMPTFVLKKMDLNGAATTFGATSTDTSASAGAYETAHSITQLAINEVINRATYRYILEFTSEGGGNFIADALLYSITTSCTVTSYPEC